MEFEREIEAIAKRIVALSWFSHQANKKLILETDGMRLGDGLAHEFYHSAGVDPDVLERIAAFRANRTAG